MYLRKPPVARRQFKSSYKPIRIANYILNSLSGEKKG